MNLEVECAPAKEAYLPRLNPAQRLDVEHGHRRRQSLMRAAAGDCDAGSGKTNTWRTASPISSGRVPIPGPSCS